MFPRYLTCLFTGSSLALLLALHPAFGAPFPPQKAGTGAPAASAPEPSTAAEVEARVHFKSGSEHFDKGDYREAYDEFRKAMALKKTRAVVGFAASSLRQLGRYDESLDLYEEILREYTGLPPEFRKKVETAIADLQRLVGTLSVAGDAPDEGALFIDDRPRGVLPLAAPIRVAQGIHAVRVVKPGFEPLTASIEIAPEKLNVVTLSAKSKKGRLSVIEKHNWALEVELDGEDVGVTPWEGFVDPGEHRVRLHGFLSVEALAECAVPDASVGDKASAGRDGAKMEAAAQTVHVTSFEAARITLGAEDTDASLRVESTPSGARLRIDGKDMGKTPWDGRLALGAHVVEVSSAGFIMAKQQAVLERRKQREISVLLEREPNLAGLRMARTVSSGLGFGVGALGLGVFAVSGALAVKNVDGIQDRCGGLTCPASEGPNVNTASVLGTVSTIGLVVGGAGVAAGTVVFFALQPKAPEKRQGDGAGRLVSLKVDAGPGGLSFTGSF